jgi:hypothetical protein
MRSYMYQPKPSLAVTIALEFLDKYGMLLRSCLTRDSITTMTDALLQSLPVLYNTLNKMSLMKPSVSA